jgi:hypothetical protein
MQGKWPAVAGSCKVAPCRSGRPLRRHVRNAWERRLGGLSLLDVAIPELTESVSAPHRTADTRRANENGSVSSRAPQDSNRRYEASQRERLRIEPEPGSLRRTIPRSFRENAPHST